MNGLKSFVYLPHAMVKPVQNRSSAFVLTGRDKSHTIAASATDELAGADAEKYLLSWKNTFEYVIERAQVFKVRITFFHCCRCVKSLVLPLEVVTVSNIVLIYPGISHYGRLAQQARWTRTRLQEHQEAPLCTQRKYACLLFQPSRAFNSHLRLDRVFRRRLTLGFLIVENGR
jgi:hypothetical protein